MLFAPQLSAGRSLADMLMSPWYQETEFRRMSIRPEFPS